MKYVFDTSILIDHLRGVRKAAAFMERIKGGKLRV
jgi:predicted nucleic acid-binding protein